MNRSEPKGVGINEWRLDPLGQKTRVFYRLEAQAHNWLVVLLVKVLDLGRLHSRSMQDVLRYLNQELDQKQHLTRQG